MDPSINKLVRAKNFPKASPFSDEELEEWRTFWKRFSGWQGRSGLCQKLKLA
jgi:hypothetical protein